MRIDQFIYLVDIYQSHSITRTAEKFFISRQVVSNAIRSLEKEMGCPLLVRTQNNLEFTQAGEIATQKAQVIVDAYKDFDHTLASFSEQGRTKQQERQLTLYAIPRMVSSILPELSVRHKKLYPNVNLKLISASSEEIIVNLPFDEHTIGFISYCGDSDSSKKNFIAPQNPNLKIYPFWDAQFFICLLKNSVYNTKETFTQEDLKTLPILSYKPAFYQLSSMPEQDINTTIAINDIYTLTTLINQDIGVGLITKAEFHHLAKNKHLLLKPIQIIEDSNIYFAYVLKETQSPEPCVQYFIQALWDLKKEIQS